jgi:hypothetical protein
MHLPEGTKLFGRVQVRLHKFKPTIGAAAQSASVAPIGVQYRAPKPSMLRLHLPSSSMKKAPPALPPPTPVLLPAGCAAVSTSGA